MCHHIKFENLKRNLYIHDCDSSKTSRQSRRLQRLFLFYRLWLKCLPPSSSCELLKLIFLLFRVKISRALTREWAVRPQLWAPPSLITESLALIKQILLRYYFCTTYAHSPILSQTIYAIAGWDLPPCRHKHQTWTLNLTPTITWLYTASLITSEATMRERNQRSVRGNAEQQRHSE